MRSFCKTLVGVFLVMIFFGKKATAQDPHFSQYFHTPLMLNPALTGFNNGDLRANVNYRTQWGSVATPFRTMHASVDFNMLNQWMDKDLFGVGLMLMNDMAGASEMRNTQAQISFAYHKALSKYGDHYLSAGGQWGIFQQTLNYSKLLFDSQFDGAGIDPTIPSGEVIPMNDLIYQDVSAGLNWSFSPKKDRLFYAGASVAHINQPQVSFFNEFGERLKPRLTLYGGAEIRIHPSMTIMPRGVFLNQGLAKEFNFGALVKFTVNSSRHSDDEAAIYFGTMHRYKDAQVIILRYDYGPVGVSFSYDMNVSSLNIASRGRGAMELALIYQNRVFNERRPAIMCPEF